MSRYGAKYTTGREIGPISVEINGRKERLVFTANFCFSMDWSRLKVATCPSDAPTPFYILREIVADVQGHIGEVAVVVNHLVTCLQSPNNHVKLKSLLVMKHIAAKVTPFRCHVRMQCKAQIQTLSSLPSVLEAVPSFQGTQLVRKAAVELLQLLDSDDTAVENERQRIEERITGYGASPPKLKVRPNLLIETVEEIISDIKTKGPVLTLKEATIDVADMVSEGMEILTRWMTHTTPGTANFAERYMQSPGNQFAPHLSPPDLLS